MLLSIQSNTFALLEFLQGSVPDVTAEDQEKINTFNKSFQRLKEINAELAGKKARYLSLSK